MYHQILAGCGALLHSRLGTPEGEAGLSNLVLQVPGVDDIEHLSLLDRVPLLYGTLCHPAADRGDHRIIVPIGRCTGVLHPVLHRSPVRTDRLIFHRLGTAPQQQHTQARTQRGPAPMLFHPALPAFRYSTLLSAPSISISRIFHPINTFTAKANTIVMAPERISEKGRVAVSRGIVVMEVMIALLSTSPRGMPRAIPAAAKMMFSLSWSRLISFS